MSIIASLIARLGLDSAAFDQGISKARSGMRGFGDECKKMGSTALPWKTAEMAVGLGSVAAAAHAMSGAFNLARASIAWAHGDMVAMTEAAYALPLGIGSAIQSLDKLVEATTGFTEGMHSIAEGIKQIQNRAAGRKIIEGIGDAAAFRAATAGADQLHKDLLANEKKFNEDIAALREGAKGREGTPEFKSAWANVADARRKADEQARKEETARRQKVAGEKAAPGEEQWKKVELGYWKVALSAEDYLRVKNQILGIEPGLTESMIRRARETDELVAAQQRAMMAIDAALPDYDAALAGFDEYLARNKDLADQATSLSESLRSPWQVLQNEVDTYTLMLEKSLLTQEEFEEAVRRAGKAAVEGMGGVSPNRGDFALVTRERQYGALPGDSGSSVPSILKQVVGGIAKTNLHLQALLNKPGGLG